MQKILLCSLLIFFNTTIIQTSGFIAPKTTSKAGQYASDVSNKIFGPIITNRIMQYSQKGASLWKKFWSVPTDKELKLLGFKHGATSIQEKDSSSKYTPSDYLEPIHDFWQNQIKHNFIQKQLKYNQTKRFQDIYTKNSLNALREKSKKIINLNTQRQKAHYTWLNAQNAVEQQHAHKNILRVTQNLDSALYHF